jgi:DNA-binding transcriptional ArsR family regulator
MDSVNTELTVLKRDMPVSQDDTIRMLLEQSKRTGRAVLIRRAFVQDADPGLRLITQPGPFSKMLRSNERLDLFLLIHCVTARADWSVTHRSETWARAAGISFATNGTASAAVSRHLHKLKELKLISTEPHGRMTKITKLLEDGSGDPYTLPSGDKEGSRKSTYFKVPFAYWEQHYYRKLSMPAKTMLLILMSQRKPSFVLHKDREYALWYGVSPSTVRRGIEELKKEHLLYEFLCEQQLDGFSVLGQSTQVRWALAAPFDLNVNKTEREAAEAAWTPEGIARTALRIGARIPALSGAAIPR